MKAAVVCFKETIFHNIHLTKVNLVTSTIEKLC